ncbi:MAG: hypothetical protein KIS95_01625 [Anaerolineae bacterium]|nr:hypothetical protein [Promineifilum sp.]MCW5845901.1 hypothetical protein [Anaerolineae bacterium]
MVAESPPASMIPVYYARTMGVNTPAAIVFGRWFDKRGLSALIVVAIIAAFLAPLVFWCGAAALLGMILWGIGMGGQESIMRAAVAGMVTPDRRGSAYGIFNASFGLAWFAGSAILGILYDYSTAALVAFSVIVQMAAIPVLSYLQKEQAS